MNKKYESLLKNTSIFALGTFGSKILVFLIVPIYTYVLSTEDYGTIDLITSSINLLIPFTTLLIYEAVIRFLVGRECEEKVAFNNSVIIFFAGSLLSIILSLVVLQVLHLTNYYIAFLILIILNSYTTIFGQYLRAKGDNWGFSISGIINTFFTVFLNLFFLLVAKKGILGYLYSLIISQVISSIYIFYKCDSFKNFDLKAINFKVLKLMLIYTLPLIPNNIMWWIMNAGDKYVINYFLGVAENGIFSIAYKIPTMLTVIFSIFMQAWQVSAIEESGEETRNNFYKNIFDTIMLLLTLCTSIIIIVVKPLFEIAIGNNYIASWRYVPLLCVGTLFNCLSTFAGVVYIVKKDSKSSSFTTFLGAIINLFINFILIKMIGLFGVTVGTVIGYLVVMLIRFKDFKRYFGISLIDFKSIITLMILVLDALLYTFIDNNFRFVCAGICIIIVGCLSKKELKAFCEIVREKIKKTSKSS